MRAFLTGGTGFVGSHVARALLRRGDEVRCLVRPAASAENLAGLAVERAEGDLLDPAALREAVRGCDAVYHCAADYRLWAPDPAALYRTNVEGTRNVLRAVAEEGVAVVVHTSSVGALGPGRDGRPADEETPGDLRRAVGHYKRSKVLAEHAAAAWAARGLRVVIVNPSTPVGEGDVKPTPTGRIVVDFLSGRMPAYVDTGLNLVDVLDVAAGHLLAAERGEPGRRYILGARNMTLREVLAALSGVSGLPCPRLRIPHGAAHAVAAAEALHARLRGRPPRVPLEGVRMARERMFFDSRRAADELGYRPGPVEPALARAVDWFRARGYAPA